MPKTAEQLASLEAEKQQRIAAKSALRDERKAKLIVTNALRAPLDALRRALSIPLGEIANAYVEAMDMRPYTGDRGTPHYAIHMRKVDRTKALMMAFADLQSIRDRLITDFEDKEDWATWDARFREILDNEVGEVIAKAEDAIRGARRELVERGTPKAAEVVIRCDAALLLAANVGLEDIRKMKPTILAKNDSPLVRVAAAAKGL